MTKKEFLAGLREKLSGLPREDIQEQVNFYSEIIDDRVEEGLSEEEAVCAVGNSDEIAAQILAEFTPIYEKTKSKKPKKALSAPVILLIVLGFPLWLSLLAAACAIIISVYIAIWAVIIALWSVCGTFAGCALGNIISGTIFILSKSYITGIAIIGTGLTLTGLAIFAFFGCRKATKCIVSFTKIYTKKKYQA